jgi:hypothetical protein
VDILNNAKHEVSRHSRIRKREYLKDKINELATNSKKRNMRDQYRGTNAFMKGYQPRYNLVKDEDDYVPADFHSILNR